MTEPGQDAAPLPPGGFQMTPWSYEFPEIGIAAGQKVLAIVVTRAPFAERFVQPAALSDLKTFRDKLDEAIRQAETGIATAAPVDIAALVKQKWTPPNGSHG